MDISQDKRLTCEVADDGQFLLYLWWLPVNLVNRAQQVRGYDP